MPLYTLVLHSAQVVSVARRTQRARLESRLLLHKHPASPGAAAVPHRLAALVEHEQLARTVESVPVQLTALRDCKLHAIVGYFDVDFLGNGDAGVNVSFSTGPLSQVNALGQTVFYLRSPISLSSGQVLEFYVSILPPHDSPRSLLVEFDWSNGNRSEFRMD
uniref:Wzt_C domain-containing protein n=1 Tax=Macrostomum lignano TaxID=282301 RepID=A0A1I8F9N9_9PLAT